LLHCLHGIVLFGALGTATPTITFPINSQVPPVARVSKPFIFIFSDSTFFSTSSLTYTLSNAPSWLSLNGNTRTLSGTPPESDANTAPVVQITAADSTGAITMYTTLVVSADPEPEVVIPIQDQIRSFGPSSQPDTLLFYPSTTFKFAFNPGTFSFMGKSTGLNHYAVTLDNTPLPSWIYFDGTDMSFSGTTPAAASLLVPPESFEMKLIASEVLGFSGAVIRFHMVVENHRLIFTDNFISVHATVGEAVDFSGLSGKLLLDGAPASSSDLVAVSAQTPDWLSFDNSTFSLKGTPPNGTTSYNVSINVVDKYRDSANAVVSINIDSTTTSILFVSTDPRPLNATIGEPFSFDFKPYIINASAVDITSVILPAATWLLFDSQSLILSGNIPSTAPTSLIELTLTATLKSGLVKRASQSKTFLINIISPAITSSSSQATSVPTSSSTTIIPTSTESSTTSTAAAGGSSRRLTASQLTAAILIPIFVLMIAILIGVIWWRRRRDSDSYRSATPEKRDISNPFNPIGQGMNSETPADSEPLPRTQRLLSITTEYDDLPVRRSQTFSGTSTYMSSQPGSTDSNQHTRSFSENHVASQDGSWRSTQGSSSAPQDLESDSGGTIVRNFSRKTKTSHPIGGDISCIPVLDTDHLPAGIRRMGSRGSSIQQTPLASYMAKADKFRVGKRRSSVYLDGNPDLSQMNSGIGHGARRSTSVLSDRSINISGRGIGHGQKPSGTGFENDSSWMTVVSSKKVRRPRSSMSAVTESTDLLYPGKSNRNTIRLVPYTSPYLAPPSSSGSENPSGQTNRNTSGSSPFFAGSGASKSVSGTKKRSPFMESYLQSHAAELAAVPKLAETNSNLEQSILRELRSELGKSTLTEAGEESRDVLGINYGDPICRYASPQEGTRQLSSMVFDLNNRQSWQGDSMNLSDASSRFRSASQSPISQYLERQGNAEYQRTGQYQQSLYNLSDTRTSFRDSNGNIISYADSISPELQDAAYLASPKMYTSYGLFGNQSLGYEGRGEDGSERIIQSPERRPISITPDLRQTSFKATSHGHAVQVGLTSREREVRGTAFL
jgi:axial budding pattern protein 2